MSDVNELSEADPPPGFIVTEKVDTILEKAQREAETIRRDAELDAEGIRHEAVTAATRLLGRLQALEFPLGQLVADLRDETQRVTNELETGAHLDSHALEEQIDEPTSDEPFVKEAARTDERRSADDPAEQAEFPVPSEPAEPGMSEQPATAFPEAVEQTAVESSKRRQRGRRKSKPAKGLFVAAEGSCAICQRTFEAGGAAELQHSGWKVSGDVGLCPDCQAHGWQLPEGARLPFRRGTG